MKSHAFGLVVLVAVLSLTPGCGATSSDTSEVTGVVVAVDGTLEGIDMFTVLLDDGTTVEVVPEPGLLFDGGPLSHLRDHLVSGSPISVAYQQEGERLVATEVGDAE